jgi:aspartate kinase
MKFGGTSLEDGEAFQRVAHIIGSNLSANVVVVVSAMSGVTDALISSFQKTAKGDAAEALRTLEAHFERHLKVAGALGEARSAQMRAVIDGSRSEIIELLDQVSAGRVTTAQGLDAMVSHGERLSASLLTIVLEKFGIPASYVDARRCIITDEQHGSAKPLLEETRRQTRAELRPLIETKRVPVLGGFIAASRNSVTTTLGRGSSDYSATLFSAALDARETQIWTDVDGVMTADPNLVEGARTVSQISYDEAAELARLGARVLHAKMIQPVTEQKIPIRILNSRVPEREGTLICRGTQAPKAAVKAIACKTGVTRIDVTSTPAFVANGFLRAIEEIFDRHGIVMQIVAKSQVGGSFICEEANAPQSLVQDLEQVGSVETKAEQATVSCVGEGIKDTAGSLRQVLRSIDPTLTWHSTSGLSLVSMVNPGRVRPIVRLIHQCLFPSEPGA